MITEERLLEMKKEVEEAKSSVSELKGQLTAILKQLKDTYKCESIEAADKQIGKIRTKKSEIQKQMEEYSAELEQRLGLSEV